MNDKRFEDAINEIEKEKFKFTMTKEQIKERILQNRKVEKVEQCEVASINSRGELEELLEIWLKVGDLINRSQTIELTLTHTGSDDKSDVYSIFGSIYFEYEDMYLGESNEITRLSDSHTASGRPDGILDWLDLQINHMTSEEVDDNGNYFRYLFN